MLHSLFLSGIVPVIPIIVHFFCYITSIVVYNKLFYILDMLAATSILQQQAADIRNQRIIWHTYLQ